MNRRMLRSHVLLLSVMAMAASAQTVYRCETAGKVSYSDAPCVGAKVVDATPTQGMDKSSGRSQKSAEVRRDEFRKTMDTALRPLTGASHEEMNTLRRRHKLQSEEKMKCAALDARLPRLEAAAAEAGSTDKARADVELYKARKQFFDLKC